MPFVGRWRRLLGRSKLWWIEKGNGRTLSLWSIAEVHGVLRFNIYNTHHIPTGSSPGGETVLQEACARIEPCKHKYCISTEVQYLMCFLHRNQHQLVLLGSSVSVVSIVDSL